MKAAVIEKENKIHVRDYDIPKLNEGEALIKVKYCGICGSDIHVLQGEHPTAEFPVVPGHEFVGELIEATGTGTEKFKKGDIVVAQPFFSCGNCEPCAKGRDNVCSDLHFMGAHMDGGFAEYVKVLTRKMYKIPKNMDLKLAALTEPVAVAIHDVRRSGLQVGETALVIGGGPIGILIALVAKQAGAGKVVISEISKFRSDFIRKMGFEVLNPLDQDFKQQADALTDGKGFDVVFEVSGSKPGITSAVEFAKITGKIVIVGMTSEPYPVNLSDIFAKELVVKGVRIHSQYNFIGAVELLKSGVLTEQFEKLISDVYSLDEVEEAFHYAQSGGDFFKILVKM